MILHLCRLSTFGMNSSPATNPFESMSMDTNIRIKPCHLPIAVLGRPVCLAWNYISLQHTTYGLRMLQQTSSESFPAYNTIRIVPKTKSYAENDFTMGACSSKYDSNIQNPPPRPSDPNNQSAQEHYHKQQLKQDKKKKKKKLGAAAAAIGASAAG